ncbi:MAG: DUF2332 domain-containing protein [Caulobacteraceae bacterium]
MQDEAFISALKAQSRACAAMGSSFYGALLDCAASDPEALRALFAPWEGQPTEAVVAAAAPLRFLGALHDLVLSGDEPALTAAYPPLKGDGSAAWQAARRAIESRQPRLAAFMRHEPQTNEVRRSAVLLPGFLEIAAETGFPLACLELGASAGLNQLWSRFRYDYGATGTWGDAASPVALTSDWTGPAPQLAAPLRVVSTAACDRSPVDVRDPAQRRRLKAYVWPDQPERMARFDAALGLALETGVSVEKADAAAWARARAKPSEGVATVIFHSIFWQYLPPTAQEDLRRTIEARGDEATATAPLAWLRMEPPTGQAMPIELRLTLWPGGEDRRLALVHAHGATVAWEGEPVSV